MWHDELMEAIKTGDKEQIKKVAELARHRYEPISKPVFDFKKLESEGREPGEDE